MRITTLSENTAGKRPKGLLAEYGLSILVETDEQKILSIRARASQLFILHTIFRG
jgi:metal-dependent hydrolase (beta-lactamase superfamily II)